MVDIKVTQKEQFDSIKQFVATIEGRENNKPMSSEHASETGSSNFCGTKTYAEAKDQLIKGWEKVLPQIKEKFDVATKGNSNGTISKRRAFNHVVGYAPNVPNAIMGLPQSMINQYKEPQKVKVVTIVYAPDANCCTEADTFIKAGIVVLNIINRLELNGKRVKLLITPMDSFKNGTFASCMVQVKDYREQLDLKKIAFPIASPSMLRRFGFKWLETFPELTEDGFACGYGKTISGEENHKEHLVKAGIIRDTDYYMNLEKIEQLRFDMQAVIKDAGIEID